MNTGQLLRVPKHNYKAFPYADLQAYWENQISPHFETHELVQQSLVKLPSDPNFVARLNRVLCKLEETGQRRLDFVGHFVDSDVGIGMLVGDMRAHALAAGNDALKMYEIKPKWLVQSPRAPKGAEQCRNCAREVWRNMKNKTKNQVFCPLNLTKASDFPRDVNIAYDVKDNLMRCYNMSEVEAKNLTAWLQTNQLIPRLRFAQFSHDHEYAVVDEERYSLAMTLRDCSLFVLVPSYPDAPPERIVAKLGDMDMKNSTAKKQYWLNMEKELHDSGVYWNTDKLSVNLTDCQLPFYKANNEILPKSVQVYCPPC